MATEVSSMPVNGNYAPHQGFGGIEQQQNNYAYNNNNTNATTPAASNHAPPTSTTPAASTSQSEISKDEVGWYFVEQYYTTLSRSPERLYLFYNKKSQFVSGQETDKVRVYGGQTAINNRIKELDFKDCKVRVTNVDAQASDSNIVIQVIGEMSNKSQPHKKFVQTFVLAAQTNGYFVLNDIFRYLVDEEDVEDAEAQAPLDDAQPVPAAESGSLEAPAAAAAAAAAPETEHKTLTSSSDPIAVEHDAREVDRELEEALKEPEPAVNGNAESEAAVQHAEDAPAAAASTAAVAAAAEVSDAPEKPVEPAPSPSPPKQATPQPPPASKPAAPKTWAAMAAGGNRIATPAAPSVATSTVSTSSQARAAPATAKTSTPPVSAPSTAAPPSAPTAPAAQREESSTDGGQSDEWTAVGGSHARQQSRQVNHEQQEGPIRRGYIKNVHEGIDPNELKSHLEQFGELTYYDLPPRKNSAYIEYRTFDMYNAAVAANPHNIGGERLYVEERRSFNQRGGFQNSRGRGNMNQGQSRGNFQNRGGFAPRGRGGNAGGAPRGRGGAAQGA